MFDLAYMDFIIILKLGKGWMVPDDAINSDPVNPPNTWKLEMLKKDNQSCVNL